VFLVIFYFIDYATFKKLAKNKMFYSMGGKPKSFEMNGRTYRVQRWLHVNFN